MLLASLPQDLEASVGCSSGVIAGVVTSFHLAEMIRPTGGLLA